MTVKDIFETATSATSVCLNFCASREDDLDNIIDHEFLSDDNIGKYADMEVTFTYPRRKDVLDIYVIKDNAFDSACQKLGTNELGYLESRSRATLKWENEGSNNLSRLNEGRIEGFLRALEYSGRFTAEEMTALAKHFPDYYYSNEQD